MKTVFVLIMLWGGNTNQSGIGVVQQEFNSWEACEYARIHLSSHTDTFGGMKLRSQGCFKKD